MVGTLWAYRFKLIIKILQMQWPWFEAVYMVWILTSDQFNFDKKLTYQEQYVHV